MEDPAPARAVRGAELKAVLREDLDAYGVEELAARIAELEGEVARTRSALARKQSGRSAADALFSFAPPSPEG